MLEEHLAKTQEDKQRQHNQHAQELERERWVLHKYITEYPGKWHLVILVLRPKGVWAQE